VRKTADTAPAGRRVLTLAPPEGGAISNLFKKKCSFRFLNSANVVQKGPASEEAGPMIRLGQPPRRDHISVKLSSPSTFTSDA
jgi:hypothetical protein